MQNKGFVRVFAILLALVCLFYLSFSLVTSRVSKKAEAYAAGNSVKYQNYLDSLSTEKVWLGYTLKQCREMEIGLGLDLKGGMNVILEISVADVLRSLSDNNQDENFNKALVAATAKQSNTNGDFISLFVDEYKALDPNAKLSAIFGTSKLSGKIDAFSTDEKVKEVLQKEVGDAIDNSFNVLRTRIDRFGVVAPNVQRLAKDGQILIELPGVKEPQRVRDLLQGSANLEFWETYELSEIYPQLIKINQLLAENNKFLEKENKDTVDVASEIEVTDSVVSSQNDDVEKILAETEVTSDSSEVSDMKAMAANNPLFSVLMLNQSQNGILPGPTVGSAMASDTAAINAMLNLPQVKDLLPRNLALKWTVKAVDEKGRIYQLVALKASDAKGRPALEGDVITDASDDFDRGNKPVVSMAMSPEGSQTWARLTKENKGRSIAIVLDNYVYSYPHVENEITGGHSQISGNFSPEEAKDLANVLKSGKMAAKVKIVQEDIIGPSLGKEAVQSGVISFVFALILLMIYMIASYGVIPGLIANIGLVINMFFTMGILASFHAVLTLSGIAGLVLSMGMAVDANVLIYERAKEELRMGKNLKKAVEEAYRCAFSAIFDSNLTSIITGLVLFYFGTGPIKGFATTLIIGIIVSFIVTIFISRLFIEAGLEKGWFSKMTFTTKISKNFLVNNNFQFLGNRRKGYIVCGIAILICVVSLFTRGLNQGIDFSGGSNYVIRFDKPVNPTQVADLLKPQFDGYALSVITIGSENQVRVSTNYDIKNPSDSVDMVIKKKMYDGLKSMLNVNTTNIDSSDKDATLQAFEEQYIQSSQKVGPSIADDIKTGAIWAVLFSLIGMGLYIFIRFRDVSFSIGAIGSLAFVTIMILGFYSLFYGMLPFSMEMDQSFIAAILTVIGYAINDTVVVFDRIREVIGMYPTRDRGLIFNEALNSTLARTFNTSVSTAIVLLCIFILGGDTIRSFTFAMLFGVVVGTLATLFVASPLAYEVQKRKVIAPKK